MIYVLFYNWANTAGNHAGMAYLVRNLKTNYPDHLSLIEIPQRINNWKPKLQRIYFYYLVYRLKFILNKNDKILFMEYLGNRSGNQTGIALKLREMGIKNTFMGLVHLPKNSLIDIYGGTEYIKKASMAADKIITFGSSLSGFFSELGFKEKVFTTFHYVETSFYKPDMKKQSRTRLNVIHMGSLMRNFEKLKEIVKQCPGIQFHICQGKKDLSKFFNDLPNVILYGFLYEQELLNLMQSCQISLSILDDTVGSNVITTSMACGLVNVVSDVGSIRDYCDESNSILCNEVEDFVTALERLSLDDNLLESMQLVARNKALNFSIENSLNEFKSIMKIV